MHEKRRKVYIYTMIVAALVLIFGVYLLVPKMFADEVYPLKYADMIVKYSTKYDVDPALVAAVILQESRFNPNAKSSAGAQGLMQFMPGTATTMAKETGHWPKYDIFDAETSVEFGAAHLHDLLVKYHGDVEQALAGYNAGTGTVDGWVSRNIFDRVINSNSKSETVTYVRKVKNYQTVYASMYAKELGIVTSPQLKEVAPTAEDNAKLRGYVWTQIFGNVLSLFNQ